MTIVDGFPVPSARFSVLGSRLAACGSSGWVFQNLEPGTRNPFTKCCAFTLAETLFAMAIVSFALLTIIGLMPSALDELRQSERRAAEARILQSLAADYELLPWQEFENFGRRGPFFFDETGLRRLNMDESTRYQAQVEAPTGGQTELTLPGESNPSPYLKQLRISITDRIQDAGALGSDIDDGKRREYYLVVAKHDADQGEVAP